MFKRNRTEQKRSDTDQILALHSKNATNQTKRKQKKTKHKVKNTEKKQVKNRT